MSKDPIKSKMKENVRERSFGSAPPTISIQGGEMHMFGHDLREGTVWPKETDPINVKTGYPEGHMNKSKGISPK
jgi:hypothetical protein